MAVPSGFGLLVDFEAGGLHERAGRLDLVTDGDIASECLHSPPSVLAQPLRSRHDVLKRRGSVGEGDISAGLSETLDNLEADSS